MGRKTILTTLLACLLFSVCLNAQNKSNGKLSTMLKRVAIEMQSQPKTRTTDRKFSREVMTLVKCTDPGVLEKEGCRTYGNWDNIYAVSIPLNRLQKLAQNKEVLRIEAGKPCNVCVDTTATLLGVNELWKGAKIEDKGAGKDITNLRSLTGKGVVVGIQDIGFDLTHPTFYSRDLKDYRIKAFWDMLDPDSLESSLYVGRDYRDKESLLEKACATDGKKQTHGVHTAGIAAGSGYDTRFIGMAPEAELCLVANAVGNDAEFISEEVEYKYTTATDVLGFQYIFDYAESVGKPCVISFSEGAHEDLYGDAQLLYEVLDKMTGPGRVIVASAGNSSVNKTYLHKPIGQDSISSFLYSNKEAAYYTLRHSDKTEIKLHFSSNKSPENVTQTFSYDTDLICSMQDSLLIDTLQVGNEQYMLLLASYPSCYNSKEWATEFYIQTLTQPLFGIGGEHRVRLTLTGRNEDVECFASGGLFLDISSLPEYCNAEPTHNINFPAAAPCIIAVGGTAYRTGTINYKGTWKNYDMGNDGRKWEYSSVGPTMQGLIKPDVMAPACNIISAYSSYYLENNPNAGDITWDVSHFTFNDRTYAWNCNSGTSMSSPVAGGIVALWLQLCPTLSPQDVMEVIKATSKHYDPLLSYPNNDYGWGEIDALAGAQYIAQHFDCTDAIELIKEDVEATMSSDKVFDIYGRSTTDKNSKGIYLIKYKNGSVKKFLR